MRDAVFLHFLSSPPSVSIAAHRQIDETLHVPVDSGSLIPLFSFRISPGGRLYVPPPPTNDFSKICGRGIWLMHHFHPLPRVLVMLSRSRSLSFRERKLVPIFSWNTGFFRFGWSSPPLSFPFPIPLERPCTQSMKPDYLSFSPLLDQVSATILRSLKGSR